MTQDYYYSAFPKYTDFDSIIQLFKTYAARYHDRVFIRYQPYPNSLEYKILTYGQVDNISTNLANIWKPTFLQGRPSSFSSHKVHEEENESTATIQEKKCIAVLNDDPVQSVLTLLATLKLGLIYFPLATHDSDAAIIHLLQKTNVSHIVTSEACYSKASRCAKEVMMTTTNMIQKNHPTTAALNSIQIKIWNNQLNIDELASNIKVTSPLLPVATEILGNEDIKNSSCNISSPENNTPGQTLLSTDTNDIINKNNSKKEPLSTDIVIYMHTSGSTKLPKLIGWSTRSILYSALVTLSQRMHDANVPFEPSDVLLIPILLITGPDIDFLLSAILAGSSIVVFHNNRSKPADLLAASEMFHGTFLFAPPAILEQLANYMIAKDEQEQKQQVTSRDIDNGSNHYQTKIATLFKRIKFCMYFGGMLGKPIGDLLMSKGLNLQSLYGSTETGIICLSDVSKKKYGYSVHVTSELMQYISFEPYDSLNESLELKSNNKKSSGEELYQCIIHNNHLSLAKGVANRPNGDFATRDLFVKQKQLTDGSYYWSFVGRIDDAFKTSYGEKVIPTPMEKIICSEHIIRNCIVVGENRECTAVMIELDQEKASGYTSQEISDKVHEAVRQGNKYALYHAVVSVPDRIYILPFDKQLPRSRKGAVVRKTAIDMFKQEIELLYPTNNNIV